MNTSLASISLVKDETTAATSDHMRPPLAFMESSKISANTSYDSSSDPRRVLNFELKSKIDPPERDPSKLARNSIDQVSENSKERSKTGKLFKCYRPIERFFNRPFSIFGQRTTLSGLSDVLLILSFFVFLPFLMLVLSMSSLYECSVNPKLPLWLLVYSIVLFAQGIYSLTRKLLNTRNSYEFLALFTFWITYGSFILVLPLLKSSNISADKSSKFYCSKLLFGWSCITLLISWVTVVSKITYSFAKAYLESD